MKKDIVLAAAGGYTWNQIDVWALSLVKSGFQGIGAVIVYDDPENTTATNKEIAENLKSIGFQVIVMPLRGSVLNQRFYDFSEVMSSAKNDLRYAVITDIRDVYFQTDPTDWIDKNMTKGKSLLAVGEGIKYKDEPWGAHNLQAGFPSLASRVIDKQVYNVGVLAGNADTVADLCLSIGMIAKSSGYQVADQSGYNILLDMEPYTGAVQLLSSEDGFGCQAGTLADPAKIEAFRPNLLDPEPVLATDGVRTAGGLLYPIVHQYDRVPTWNQQLREQLNNKLKA